MMRGRRGDILAPKYGFDGVEDLAESLPPQARVLDVGAGLSTLGENISKLRPDIDWTNADNQYGDPGKRYAARFEDAVEMAPKNLQFVEANAVDLAAIFGTEQFDRVFSYWMLPHIMRNDHNAGVRAAENMLMVAKKSGSVAIGPVSRPFFSKESLRDLAMEVQPAEELSDLAVQAGEIVARHERIEGLTIVGRLLHRQPEPIESIPTLP